MHSSVLSFYLARNKSVGKSSNSASTLQFCSRFLYSRIELHLEIPSPCSAPKSGKLEFLEAKVSYFSWPFPWMIRRVSCVVGRQAGECIFAF